MNRPINGMVHAAAFLLLAGSLLAPPPAPGGVYPRRIVSLAPSVTETLFALGLGERVVGVTRFCDTPPEAAALPKVGGYLDPNYEAIVSLAPDLVILLREHEEAASRLRKLGIAVLAVDHGSVSGILLSLGRIGWAAGAAARAASLERSLRQRMEEIGRKVRGLPRPRVMVVVGRNLASDSLQDVYISGKDGYYDELVALAGGENAYRDKTLKFPAVSAEGILRLDPQVILEMIPGVADKPEELARAKERWMTLKGVEAVERGRVHILGRPYAVVPGPRFVLLLADMARAIHPEVKWDE